MTRALRSLIPGMGEHQFDNGAKGLNARVRLPIKEADGNVEGIDPLKMQLQQKPMMRHDPAMQRLAQFFRRRLDPGMG